MFRFGIAAILLLVGVSAKAEGQPEVQRAIMIQTHQLKKCYNDALKRTPKLKSGKVTMAWIVNDRGAVSHVTAVPKKSTLHDASLEKCMIAKIQTWKLPPAPKGTSSAVASPFYFNTPSLRIPAKAPAKK